jgi:hypothetical protein
LASPSIVIVWRRSLLIWSGIFVVFEIQPSRGMRLA